MKDFRIYSDEEIIAGILKNDKNAFKAIFHNRTVSLKRFVLNNGGSQHETDEIEQKSVVLLYEKLAFHSLRLNPGTQLSTFIFAIGKNLWYQELRRKARKINLDDLGEISTDLEDVSLHEFEATDEEEKLLISKLNQLSKLCQQLLKAKYYERISDKALSIVLKKLKK